MAVCPHPPLLVPQVAPGAEVADLRAACVAAVDRLVAAGPDSVLVVGCDNGGDEGHRAYPPGSRGSFERYGDYDVEVVLGGGNGAAPAGRLPLSLLVGGWLVRRSAAASRLGCSGLGVAEDATPAECARLGRELAAREERIGLLVMGDGSACHSEHSPVHLHPRAEVFDATVSRALATADTDTLSRLDPTVAAELSAGGRAAWQVMAAAAGPTGWDAELTYSAWPYGVGYFVSSWRPSRPARA